MTERWLPVPGYEDLYEVSDLGRVRSVDRVIPRKTGLARYRGQVLKVWIRPSGYAQVVLSASGRQQSYLVHELVAAAFIGPRPGRLWVAHNDGDPSNNAASNLRYDTPTGNHGDKRAHGTLLLGETHPNARLSEVDVKEIRSRYARERKVDLAAEFGVTANHIYRIAKGVKWSHV